MTMDSLRLGVGDLGYKVAVLVSPGQLHSNASGIVKDNQDSLNCLRMPSRICMKTAVHDFLSLSEF